MNLEEISDVFSHDAWLTQSRDEALTGSIETLASPIDKYGLSDFAKDDPVRFFELVKNLSDRDAEIMICFSILEKRPTDLSVLFGKAGHRAEEDLHKAAHKLAGLIAFGPDPSIDDLSAVLSRHGLTHVGKFPFAAFVRRYARCRDFSEMAKMMKARDWRRTIARAFKILHAAEGREAGLLAGWLLWLVDGSHPNGKGWRPRKRVGREYQLGPTVIRSNAAFNPRATGRGGQGQRPDVVKITRKMKFLLRGMNAN